jgi:hypothetical protein
VKPLLIVLVVILGGCAPGSIPPAALDAWSDCVLRAVAQLDDGKTDPLSIAHGSHRGVPHYMRMLLNLRSRG